MKDITYFLCLAISLFFLAVSCDSPSGVHSKSDNEDETSLPARGGGGGETDIAGNNLSFPVIWSDGVTKSLRGTYLVEIFEGESFVKNDSTWYVQDDPLNSWQAESYNPGGEESPNTILVSSIDWGDNLEAKSWPYGAQIRVETVLYKILTGEPMTAYRMMIYDESISGLDEIWGTNGATYRSREATIYSGTARLVIQKLTKARDDSTLSVIWNPAISRWTGDINSPVVNSGVWTNISGPTAYSAEINVQGKLIYGYNWVTKRDGDGEGDYRITFALEPQVPGLICNTFFDANTTILTSEEETETVLESEAEPVSTGGVAEIDVINNLTFIDVRLTPQKGGGKSGKGGNGPNH